MAGLWGPFGRPVTYGACLEFIKIPMIIDERGCNLTSKRMTIDGRGEHRSKMIDIKYRQMCQTHKTILNKSALGNLHACPAKVMA